MPSPPSQDVKYELTSTSGMELLYSCEGLCLCDTEFKLLQLAEVNDAKIKESIFQSHVNSADIISPSMTESLAFLQSF